MVRTEALSVFGTLVFAELGQRPPINFLIRGLHSEHGFGSSVTFFG